MAGFDEGNRCAARPAASNHRFGRGTGIAASAGKGHHITVPYYHIRQEHTAAVERVGQGAFRRQVAAWRSSARGGVPRGHHRTAEISRGFTGGDVDFTAGHRGTSRQN